MSLSNKPGNAKTAIINSFKELLHRESMDHITVKKICEHSKVNRQTFYHHYSDMMELFQTVIFEDLSETIPYGKAYPTTPASERPYGTTEAQISEGDSWECTQIFLFIMLYLQENSPMILNVYDSSYRSKAEAYFEQVFDSLLNHMTEESAENIGGDLRREEQKFIVAFYKFIFTGFMDKWISEGMTEDPNNIVENIRRIMPGDISNTVKSFLRDSSL